jgi:sulfur-oxidizing protein SoxX
LISVRSFAWLGALILSQSAVAGTEEVNDRGLVPYVIADGASIPTSLTGTPGNSERGKRIAIDRQLGNCLTCHRMPIPEEPDPGDVGTDLRGAGSRWSEGELRLRIVNAKTLNPATIMPAFYRVERLHRVAKNAEGKPILSAQQIEDVVAYLRTLTE